MTKPKLPVKSPFRQSFTDSLDTSDFAQTKADAARYRLACLLLDNAEELLAAVMCNEGDQNAINSAFDKAMRDEKSEKCKDFKNQKTNPVEELCLRLERAAKMPENSQYLLDAAQKIRKLAILALKDKPVGETGNHQKNT